MLRILSICACLLCLVAPVQSQDRAPNDDWVSYRNPQYGLTLRYPSHVFNLERATQNGDGHLFVSQDRKARLLVGENSPRKS